MCVLVVEDDKTLGRVFIKQLDRLGIKADLVTNGEEAVERVRQACYGLVLMDIGLPDQDGLATTRQIKKDNAQVKVVAVTAGHASREECLSAGMVDFFLKPLLSEHMKELIGRWPPGECPAGDGG